GFYVVTGSAAVFVATVVLSGLAPRPGREPRLRDRGVIAPLAADLVLQLDLAVLADGLQARGEAPQARDVAQHLVRTGAERPAAVGRVAQGERAVAAQVDVPYLHVGFARAQ